MRSSLRQLRILKGAVVGAAVVGVAVAIAESNDD